MNEKTMTKDSFSSLLDVLSLIKDVCNDVDIRNGEIRQLVNNKSFLVEADLQTYLDDSDLVLPLIKNKLSLLSIFLDGSNDNEIKFMEFDNKYIFSDDVTLLRFTVSSNSEHLDNKHMTIEERDKLFIVDPLKLLFSCKLDKFIQNKIKIITENLNVDDVIINIVDNQASFDIVSFNKLNDAKILKNIPVQLVDGKHYRVTLSAIPFKLDYQNDLEFFMYDISENGNGKVLCKLETEFNDCKLNIYLPGFLVPVEE